MMTVLRSINLNPDDIINILTIKPRKMDFILKFLKIIKY